MMKIKVAFPNGEEVEVESKGLFMENIFRVLDAHGIIHNFPRHTLRELDEIFGQGFFFRGEPFTGLRGKIDAEGCVYSYIATYCKGVVTIKTAPNYIRVEDGGVITHHTL